MPIRCFQTSKIFGGKPPGYPYRPFRSKCLNSPMTPIMFYFSSKNEPKFCDFFGMTENYSQQISTKTQTFIAIEIRIRFDFGNRNSA